MDTQDNLSTLDAWLDKWNSSVEDIHTTSSYLANLLAQFPNDGTLLAYRVKNTARDILNSIRESERQARQLERLCKRHSRP